MYHMMNFGYNGFGWIFWLIILGVIVFLIIKLSNNSHNYQKEETPLSILKKRYARGDISKEEFDKMKIDIIK